VNLLPAILHALNMAFAMFWEILSALILGFGLSGVVQAIVSKEEMSKLLPDDLFKTMLKATALGAASSSCSYASLRNLNQNSKTPNKSRITPTR
jgi:uncharacterized membrane protein YraQ (UPF0718 family)